MVKLQFEGKQQPPLSVLVAVSIPFI